MNPYTFKQTTDGNIEVYQNEGLISTGTASAASRYGYVPSTQNAPKPVSVISTENGVDTINRQTQKLEALTPPVTTPVKTEAPKPVVSTSVKLLNPITGQEAMFDDAAINKENIQSLMARGYELSESKGVLPIWMTTTNSQEIKIQEATDAAIKELETLRDGLTKYTISDAELTAQTNAITSQYNARIEDMRRINEARKSNINTLGIRLGSQYAGGAGGVFGGIISEEERQGVSRIAELEGAKQSAIASAKSAAQQQNWTVYSKQIDIAEKMYAEKIKTVEELNKAMIEQNKKVREQMIQASRDQVIGDLMLQGITEPIQMLSILGDDFTAKEIGETMKNLVPGKTVSDLGTDGNMFNFAKENGWLKADATIFDYWKMEASSKKSPSAEKVGMGSGTSSDFAQFSKEAIAMSVLPPTLRNSDAEKEYFLGGIRSGLAQGKTPYEIADVLMGYNITEPSAFSEGLRRYLSIAGDTKNVAPEIARLVNAQQYDKAITMIENEIYTKVQKQEGDSYVSEADATFVANKVKQITDLLGANWSDSIGPFEGTFNQALMRFRTRDYQKIKTKVNTITAELINKRAGSNMTDSEWKRLVADAVPQMTDKAGIFTDKLSELKGAPLEKLNSERSMFELPKLTEAELFDRKLRIPLYSSKTALDPVEVQKGPVQPFNTSNPININI